MTNKNSLQASLAINDFEMPVFLGWPDDERQEPQLVSVTINILFEKLPLACETDNLTDTFCYDFLLEQLKQKTAENPIRLIEHLAKKIHDILQELLPSVHMLSVSVTKKPNIAGLKNGVTFSCVSFKENE